MQNLEKPSSPVKKMYIFSNKIKLNINFFLNKLFFKYTIARLENCFDAFSDFELI